MGGLFPRIPQDPDSACPNGGKQGDTAVGAHRFIPFSRAQISDNVAIKQGTMIFNVDLSLDPDF